MPRPSAVRVTRSWCASGPPPAPDRRRHVAAESGAFPPVVPDAAVASLGNSWTGGGAVAMRARPAARMSMTSPRRCSGRMSRADTARRECCAPSSMRAPSHAGSSPVYICRRYRKCRTPSLRFGTSSPRPRHSSCRTRDPTFPQRSPASPRRSHERHSLASCRKQESMKPRAAPSHRARSMRAHDRWLAPLRLV